MPGKFISESITVQRGGWRKASLRSKP